jgi:hypothetical protein
MADDDHPLRDLVERQICDTLRGLASDLGSTSPDRVRLNAEVRRVLAELGDKIGYGAYPSSDQPRHASEWVYDIAWLDQSNGTEGYLLDLPLACESELGSQAEASDDFERLLLCRARHRLMVYAVDQRSQLPAWQSGFIRQISECKLTEFGDRYLLAGWVWSEQGFDLLLYVVGAAA